jgi:hypothetical protein
MAFGLAVLITIDLLTGIRKTLFLSKVKFSLFKIEFWHEFTSKGLRDTWRKSYEYATGIIVFAIFESLVFNIGPIDLVDNKFTLTQLAVILASLIEVYSIFENMEAVSGNNFLKRLTFLLPESLRKILSDSKKKEEEEEEKE